MKTQEAVRPLRGRCRLDLRVPAVPRVVHGVRRALADLDLPQPLLDDARLLVSELVANSIRHAGLAPDERVKVRVLWTGRKLRVDVRDRPAVPASGVVGAIRPDPGGESGWGLYLMDTIADRWGAAPGRFWFELELEPAATSSPCSAPARAQPALRRGARGGDGAPAPETAGLR